MKYAQLGEFEEQVMLMIGILGEEAYGVMIKEEMKEQLGKRPSIGALHTTLKRLEQQGFISSYQGGATQVRGGRRKRFYQLTMTGKAALKATNDVRKNLYNQIPGLAWE